MKLTLLSIILSGFVSYGFAQSKLNSLPSYKPAAFVDHDRIKNLEKAFAGVDKIYREHAGKNHFPGMAYGIVADGKLIHAGATGIINVKSQKPATPQSLFRIASMTKSFTAMAIMKLQEEGKLNITDPASKYIPEMKDFLYPTKDTTPIKIHNLLTMTSGFPEDNPWGDRQLEDSDAEFLSFLKDGVSFSTTPGQQFEYSNLGYAILGDIVKRVSGIPYQEYISKNILLPLGMTNTYWEFSKVAPDVLAIGYRWEDEQWKQEPMLHDGVYGAMGGLITTIDDFSKYVAFHLLAYPHRNDAETGPVKRSSVREMHKPYMPSMVANAKAADGSPCPLFSGYGFGLGYRQDCKGIIRVSHSGGLPGFGSEYRFYPEYGVGVICFANRTYAGAGAVNARVIDTLLLISGIKPRVLPASDILVRKKEQIIKVLPSFDEKLTGQIFAENFFLDQAKETRIKFINDILAKTGKIVSYGPMIAENQLRGSFVMKGERGNVNVYFTLSPERDPKIQFLEVTFIQENQ